MLAKRVIPCLDVHNGRVTRGQQFGRAEDNGLRNVGDPVELAIRYNEQGADELVFFDITASSEGRKSIIDVIERTADHCFMPLTVGGGVRSVEDMRTLLRAGADKISLNSAALARPEIIAEGAAAFGNQCMVVSIDAKKTAPGEWSVFSRGGRERTAWEARAWAQKAVALGAGEIVLNSIDSDGMQTGYDLEITRLISEQVPVPVVASGGAWELEPLHRRPRPGQGRRRPRRQRLPLRQIHHRPGQSLPRRPPCPRAGVGDASPQNSLSRCGSALAFPG